MNALSLFTPRFTSDLFDAIDKNFGDFTPSLSTAGSPKVDVRETKDSYVMDMELPGFTEKDVEINLKDKVLSISSKTEEKKEEKKDGEWLIRERRELCFSRRFTLPNDIDEEKVHAGFKNGLLSITIPRKPEAQARTIQISA